MARFRYEIIPIPQGWEVRCNGVAGPPYSSMSDAVLDTLSTADQLRRQGDRVEVGLLELDGTRRRLEGRDAHLYAHRPS